MNKETGRFADPFVDRQFDRIIELFRRFFPLGSLRIPIEGSTTPVHVAPAGSIWASSAGELWLNKTGAADGWRRIITT